MDYKIIKLIDYPKLKESAAKWFSDKFKVDLKIYSDSMDECLKHTKTIPQWYLAIKGDRIIGGLGVIENDFHERIDLTPNVCAVYTEEDMRCKGIAGEMLKFVCNDMKENGIDTLYLITDHTSFYERYGWEFLCNVHFELENKDVRLYIHKQ